VNRSMMCAGESRVWSPTRRARCLQRTVPEMSVRFLTIRPRRVAIPCEIMLVMLGVARWIAAVMMTLAFAQQAISASTWIWASVSILLPAEFGRHHPERTMGLKIALRAIDLRWFSRHRRRSGLTRGFPSSDIQAAEDCTIRLRSKSFGTDEPVIVQALAPLSMTNSASRWQEQHLESTDRGSRRADRSTEIGDCFNTTGYGT